MENRPILYSFRRCPYAMRARMALLASETQVTLREILLRDKPAAMLEASPKGTVPVLVLGDGTVVDESLDVMQWALSHHDPMGLTAHRDADLIAQNDGPFKQALDRYKYPTRYELDDVALPRAEGMQHLRAIDQRLSGQKYLAGNAPGFTDFAVFPFIRQFSMVDGNWFAQQQLPNLKPWLASLVESEMFAAAMVKHQPWQEGDTETIFG